MSDLIINLFYYTVKMSTPLLLCTIGGVFVQKAGTMNFALEAAINASAFSSIVFTVITGNIVIGIFSAIASCLLLNFIFGLFVIRFRANAVIIGLALNMLMMAIPPYLLQTFFESRGLIMATHIINIGNVPVDIPILRDIPILGAIFNGQTPLTYFAYLSIVILTLVFYKTKYGIYVQVTGENQDAAEAVGIKTDRIKWIALIISAVMCALAGMNLSLEQVGSYSLNMSAARGLICLSAINCGRREPVRSCVFALLFGFSKALQLVIAGLIDPITATLMNIVPYLTIIAVFLFTEIPVARKNTMRIFREN